MVMLYSLTGLKSGQTPTYIIQNRINRVFQLTIPPYHKSSAYHFNNHCGIAILFCNTEELHQAVTCLLPEGACFKARWMPLML